MHLPNSKVLPVNLLAACFNRTTATYKFYWLLSILQEVEKDNNQILKKDLFARMISNAWYTVNYFHVSFGKQDLIQEAVRYIHNQEHIPIDEKQDSVLNTLIHTNDASTNNKLYHFNNYVPTRFLSPWFPSCSDNEIHRASQSFTNNCLYALHEDHMIINLDWMYYLQNNVRLLKDFCYWNLSLFLQKKNPNVPDIANKLIKPARRKNLTRQRKEFWDIVIHNLGSIRCIYKNTDLIIGNYALDHFIPYNFVSHDLIWNLIPADSSFNSIKSDKLPPPNRYFSKFYALQKSAVDIIKTKAPNNKLLEDYLTIFPDLNQNFSEEKFKERIQPLLTIASNNGFQYMP